VRIGLVEHEKPNVGEQCSREREALTLAPRDARAAFADIRVQTVGKGRDPVPGVGANERIRKLVVGRIRPGDQEVLTDGRREEVRLLAAQPNPDFLFVAGDDRTDEDLFERTRGSAWTVHVGSGPTQAAFAVPDFESVRKLLEIFVGSQE